MTGQGRGLTAPVVACWLDAEPDGAAWVGPDGAFRLVNAPLCRLLGKAADDLVGHSRCKTLRRLLLARLAEPEAFECCLERLAAGGLDPVRVELTLAGEAGRVLVYESRALLDGDGRLQGWRESLRDASDDCALRRESAELRRELEDTAFHLQTLRDDVNRRIRRRDEFIARVSHELRTPMTAIIGFSHMVLRYSGELSEQQRAYLNKILKNATILLQLLNNVLDISKLNCAKLDVMVEEVDLPAIVAEVVETVEPQTWEKGLRIDVDLDPDLPCIGTDRLKLKQILINLLSNAVKYTDEGSVRLAAAPRRGGVSIEVIDSGIGIPADQLERIFEAYTQVGDPTHYRNHGSTGLGLAISRRLVELLHGELSVDSQPGDGSRFALWLPLRRPPVSSDSAPGSEAAPLS